MQPPSEQAGTFMGVPVLRGAPGRGDAVIIGAPRGVSYPVPGPADGCVEGPAAIRRRSQRLARFVGHHDFDLDGPLLPAGATLRIHDGGDLAGPEETREEVARLVTAGAVPIVLGGDDSITIPVLRGLGAIDALTVLQFDAHLDYRDEVAGVREGYSSAMRRASEMAHVARIVQVGLRGVGSARVGDVADARGAGNVLVTVDDLHAHGADLVLDQLPAAHPVFIALDLDALDPSVTPGVSAPAPGGMSYAQVRDLLVGVGTRFGVVGAVVTELAPQLDRNEITALVAARLVSVLIGAVGRRRLE
ncbi:MAG: hypothetical protein DLM71_01300 [Chloroflexi bacterium]|nr:MAG: hypothetical protein DLM71_01300 [Chloroflexota bacterium]